MELTIGGTLAALSNDIATAVERVAPSVVAVEGRERGGSSGFFLAPHTIVTADHTLERDNIKIVFADGRVESARIIGRDSATDIALLGTATGGPQPLAHVASDDVKVGAIALAVARDDDGDLAATMGVIGTVGGAWRTWRGGEIERFLRPDLSLSPRFSGSPLVSASGAVMGMNTWGLSRRQSLSVPIATIARIADLLQARGHVARGDFGIAMQAVEIPGALGGGCGAIVLGVAPHGPADKGGLIVGDIITTLHGRPVSDRDDVQALLNAASVGSPTVVRIIRGGTPHECTITLGDERPTA